MIKISHQLDARKYTVLGVDGKLPPNKTGKVKIDGIKYKTEIIYDFPDHIAIIGTGNFVGKEIEFNV